MTAAERLSRLSPAHQALWWLWSGKSAGIGKSHERIAALIVERAGQSVDPEELRLFVQHRLPGYMIPAQIVKVDKLPRSPAGKLARSRLRVPEPAEKFRRVPVAPRNEMEERLAALFERVLHYRPVGVFDDFFADLGGHSLLATQLVSAIRREFQRDVPLRSIFEHPTVARMAESLSAL